MDRRTFLKTTSAAAAATAASASTAGAVSEAQHADAALTAPTSMAKRHTLRVAIPDDAHTAHTSYAADDLLRRLSQVTGGDVVFEQTASVDRVLKAIADGTCEAALVAGAGPDGRIFPELTMFTGLPGSKGLSPDDHLAWMTAAGGEMFWQDVLAPHGATGVLVGHSGRNIGLWARREIGRLADLRTASFQATGTAASILEHLGCQSVSIAAAAEIWQVEASVAEAAAFAGNRPGLRWFEGGLHANGHARVLIVATSAWQRMTDTQRAQITAAGLAAYATDLAQSAAHDRMVAPALFKARGIVRHRLPDDVRAAIDHVALGLVEQAAGRSPAAARAWEYYNRFAETMTGVPIRKNTVVG